MTQSSVHGSPSEGLGERLFFRVIRLPKRTITTVHRQFLPPTGEAWKLMHRLVYRRPNRGDPVLDRLLYLLEDPHLDLAHS